MTDRDPLEDLLRAAMAKAEPVPPVLLEASSALFDLVDAEAALAELVEAEGVAVRAETATQQTFRWSPATELHLQMTRSDSTLGLIGLLDGLEAQEVRVDTVDGESVTVEVTLGSFEAQVERRGWIRLVVLATAGRFATPWLRAIDG